MRRKPFIRNQGTAVAVGLALFGAGCYVLWDAFEGRGNRVPVMLRPLVPF